MNHWYRVTLVFLAFSSLSALAEPDSFGLGSGRDGALTVSAAGTVINRYAQVVAPIAPGDKVLVVEDSEQFSPGDLVMVWQVTGQVPERPPGLTKPIDLANDEVGRWEFGRLKKSQDGVLTLTAPLVHSYAAQVTQVIRVPEYTNVIIQKGASLHAIPWDGRSGGLVALLATGEIKNEGELSATAAGFRGGSYVPAQVSPIDCLRMGISFKPSGMAGEGVSSTQFGRSGVGGSNAANGGGGGSCLGAGGGGGGNQLAGRAGRVTQNDPETFIVQGGEGGVGLTYSLSERLVFGGGGGSGYGEDWSAPQGGTGGGVIFIRASSLSGRGQLTADGSPGGNAIGASSGGGGAGGSIYLNLWRAAECGGASALGGVGGNTVSGLLGVSGFAGGGGGEGRIMILGDSLEKCPAIFKSETSGFDFSGTEGLNQSEALIKISAPLPGYVRTHQHQDQHLDVNGTVTGVAAVSVWVRPIADEAGVGGSLRQVKEDKSWEEKIVPGSGPWDFDNTEGACFEIQAKSYTPTAESSKVLVRIDNTLPTVTINTPGGVSNEREPEFKFQAVDEKTPCPGDPKWSGCPGCNDAEGNKLGTSKCSLVRAGVTPEYESCSGAGSHKRPIGVAGKYDFYVKAVDLAGNESTAAKIDWTADFEPPTVVITKEPTGPTNSTAQFQVEFLVNDDVGAKAQCALDSGAFVDCSSPYSTLVNDDGMHIVSVRAIDGIVRSPPVTATTTEWEIDRTPPDLKIAGMPAERSNTRDAVFIFSSTNSGDVNSTQCAMSNSAAPAESEYKSCTAKMEHKESVSEGPHRLVVRAVDKAGNYSKLVSHSWRVDVTSPETKITSAPKELVNTKIANFQFFSAATDVVAFECVLKKVSPVEEALPDPDCSFEKDGKTGSAKGQSNVEVGEGRFVFAVNAVDEFGNRESVQSHIWTVDVTPPVVEIAGPLPLSVIGTRTPYIEGKAEPSSEVTISIDGNPIGRAWADAYIGRWIYPISKAAELDDGEHTMSASAVDPAQNVSKSMEPVKFYVDVTPPTTTIVEAPNKVHNLRKSKFVFSSSERVDFQCDLDGVLKACEAEYAIESLPNGVHTLTVRARDRAGNEASPVSYVWTVHVDAPLYPDIIQPADGSEVSTGTPLISGRAVPNGSVVILIDDKPNKAIPVDPNGNWTFMPETRLEEGSHSLSGESVDTNGTSSETRSPEIFFKVSLAKEAGLLSGGAGCSSSGADVMASVFSLWGLLALLGVSRKRGS